MWKSLRRGFWGFLAITFVLLVGRVMMSFAIVAGSMTQTISALYTPADIERGLRDAARGFQALTQGMNLQAGRRQTISVFDVPAEIAAMRKAPPSHRTSGGALILQVEAEPRAR